MELTASNFLKSSCLIPRFSTIASTTRSADFEAATGSVEVLILAKDSFTNFSPSAVLSL